MGIGGPKDYGLTRRMVQLFILSLVREGGIRLGVGPKSGLSSQWIDYSNIADIDFSAKILDSLTEIQKMAKPENRELLRPYAEKILGEKIPSTHDDAIISEYRAKLHNLFEKEKDGSLRLADRTKGLFETLKGSNPYEKELDQVTRLFSIDLETGSDIDMLLYGLKDIFGYKAFDSGTADQTEVDDLANRLKNYKDIKNFLSFENEILTTSLYCKHRIPKEEHLKEVLKTQQKVIKKLANLQPYIDSEVKLKTELVGKIPPEKGETGTIGRLIHEYTTVYITLHDSVTGKMEEYQREIDSILYGHEIKAFKILENITALQPGVCDGLEGELSELSGSIFNCPNSSRKSIEEQVKRGPVHECGMTFSTAQGHLNLAEEAADEANQIFNKAFDSKMEIFLNPTVREKLKQGESETVISGLLKCNDVKEVRSYLVELSLDDPSIVDVINKFIKRIIVKRIELKDFEPSLKAFERNQIHIIIQDFEKYLEDELDKIGADKETLPMLKID